MGGTRGGLRNKGNYLADDAFGERAVGVEVFHDGIHFHRFLVLFPAIVVGDQRERGGGAQF